MDLWQTLIFMYPKAKPSVDYKIGVAKGVQTITEWNSNLGAQPTDAELQAAQPALVTARQAAQARAQRDKLLAETDWMVLRAYEANIPVPTGWNTYRQALRDIPTQTGFPATITWPTKPV